MMSTAALRRIANFHFNIKHPNLSTELSTISTKLSGSVRTESKIFEGFGGVVGVPMPVRKVILGSLQRVLQAEHLF